MIGQPFRFWGRRLLVSTALLLFPVYSYTQTSTEEGQALADITRYKMYLMAQKRKHAQNSESEDSQALTQWQALAEKFVFSRETQLDPSVNQAEQLLQQDKSVEAQVLLQYVEEQYKRLVNNLDLIGKTIEAEQRAEKTRADSKMYFMMRVRSELPPKTLKAYGLMELAKQERDQGRFTEALDLWTQAETLVRESFNEHIEEMAKWREQSIQEAENKRLETRKRVEEILSDYFVTVPAGTFMMGSIQGGNDEQPVHKVTIREFKIGKTEVTFELYDLCVESTRCYSVPSDQGWGRDQRPVINVSHRDITNQFLPWLNELTGGRYRLPTEAEWEYAARAGRQAEYTWGDNITCPMARFDGGGTSVCNAREGKNRGTVPVKSYKPNAFGIYDMHGNAWEWAEDCWNPNYDGAPTDGSAWKDGNCEVRVLRGGSWDYHKSGLRSANRFYFSHQVRKPNFGFRLADK